LNTWVSAHEDDRLLIGVPSRRTPAAGSPSLASPVRSTVSVRRCAARATGRGRTAAGRRPALALSGRTGSLRVHRRPNPAACDTPNHPLPRAGAAAPAVGARPGKHAMARAAATHARQQYRSGRVAVPSLRMAWSLRARPKLSRRFLRDRLLESMKEGELRPSVRPSEGDSSVPRPLRGSSRLSPLRCLPLPGLDPAGPLRAERLSAGRKPLESVTALQFDR
jgi:hypothetical protein